jgi:hypothetical protein
LGALSRPPATRKERAGNGCEYLDIIGGVFAMIINGTPGPDTINGTSDADEIHAGGGADIIHANGGDDLIYLDATTDIVAGEVIDGGTGNDTLIAVSQLNDPFRFSLVGVTLSGVETLRTSGTARIGIGTAQLVDVTTFDGSFFFTDSGAISLAGKNAAATVTFELNAAGNQLDLSAFTPSVGGFTIVAGSDSADSITGTGSADQLFANGGDDFVFGGGGGDTLDGGAGGDTLRGGTGADTLTGGAGNDLFSDSKAGLNGDTISDFSVGDKIVLTDATLAGFTYSLSGHTLTYTGGSLTLTNVPGGRIVAAAAAGGGVELTVVREVHNDFNGDGKSDLLWRSDAGYLSDWLGTATGALANNDANAATWAPTSWHVAGTGDFNGDGKIDLLWRADSGHLSNWLGSATGGFANNDANAATWAPTSWHIVGTGDFNGDGKSDILWRADTGHLSDWLGSSSGAFVNNDANAATWAPTSWHIVGTGDFNGDGKVDLLWRADTGHLSDWLGTASGGFVNNDNNAATWAPTNWTVVATGDFNGDHIDDILWRADTGHLSNWLGTATGGFVNNDANAATWAPSTWHIAATGDFNGDGKTDIAWRADTGHLSNWLGSATGGFVNNDANAATWAPTDWHVQDALL